MFLAGVRTTVSDRSGSSIIKNKDSKSGEWLEWLMQNRNLNYLQKPENRIYVITYVITHTGLNTITVSMSTTTVTTTFQKGEERRLIFIKMAFKLKPM